MNTEKILNEQDSTCPTCLCDCAGSHNFASTEVYPSNEEDEFVDLLDIYNQSDLDNGVFNEGKSSFQYLGRLKKVYSGHCMQAKANYNQIQLRRM